MRSRWLGASIALVAAVAAGCTEEDPEARATLPPIVTTTSTTTTSPPTTTIPRFYEVQRGDTLTGIADTFGIPIRAIMAANGITDQNNIQAGQVLQLPSPDIVANTRQPVSSSAPPGT